MATYRSQDRKGIPVRLEISFAFWIFCFHKKLTASRLAFIEIVGILMWRKLKNDFWNRFFNVYFLSKHSIAQFGLINNRPNRDNRGDAA